MKDKKELQRKEEEERIRKQREDKTQQLISKVVETWKKKIHEAALDGRNSVHIFWESTDSGPILIGSQGAVEVIRKEGFNVSLDEEHVNFDQDDGYGYWWTASKTIYHVDIQW